MLASTVAAGLDGIERQLPLPPPGPPQSGSQVTFIPDTLEAALKALEQDDVIQQALGPVVDYFLTLKRQFEIKPLEKECENLTEEQKAQKERDLYMAYI